MMLVSGLIAGLIHTISGPDHLAAIAPLTTKNTNQRYRIGFYWSLGHTLGLLIFFICALSLKDIFDLHTLSSIPEHIIALADVFEALTASDRPYKKPKTINEAISIMSNMVEKKHLDKEVFHLFLKEKVYLKFAQNFLSESQLDEVDVDKYINGQEAPIFELKSA